jgi:hypothetical protein
MKYDRQYIQQRIKMEDCGYKTTCWTWKLARDKDGYGKTQQRHNPWNEWAAHRLAWRIYRGDIVHQLDHLCCNPSCVRPSHLEDVPQSVNQERARIRRAQEATKCPEGHLWAENMVFRQNRPTTRICRACRREIDRKASLRRKAKRKADRECNLVGQ